MIPGPGGCHMPQRNEARGPQVTSLGPVAGALQQEKAMMQEAHAWPLESTEQQRSPSIAKKISK